MLKSVYANHKYVRQVVIDEEYDDKVDLLSKDEIGVLQDVIRILQPFESATRQISGMNYEYTYKPTIYFHKI